MKYLTPAFGKEMSLLWSTIWIFFIHIHAQKSYKQSNCFEAANRPLNLNGKGRGFFPWEKAFSQTVLMKGLF